MRTTVTLDPDVVAKLQALMRARGLSFMQALNDSVRAGLAAGSPEPRTYRVPSRRLGPAAGRGSGPGAVTGGRPGGRGGRPQARAAQVKLPDVNLLIYAVDETTPKHAAAEGMARNRAVRVPYCSAPGQLGRNALGARKRSASHGSFYLAFVRLSTRPALFTHPLSGEEAVDLVDGWLDQPSATVVHPTSRHAAVLRGLLRQVGTAGNLTTDAHLAALALDTVLSSAQHTDPGGAHLHARHHRGANRHLRADATAAPAPQPPPDSHR